MNIPAIPSFILCHTALYRVYTAKGSLGDKDDDNIKEYTLDNVRIELDKSLQQLTYNTRSITSGKLYYDITNSTPIDIAFYMSGDSIGENICAYSEIEFDGESYRLIGVERCYSDDTLHHVIVSFKGV